MSVQAEATTYCAVHTNREASLRCNKCDRYMCVQCAVQTPVGYRCRECARAQEKHFFRATNIDATIIFSVCAVLGGGAAVILNFGGLFVAFFFGLPAGAFVGQLALRFVKGRRGRYFPLWGVLGTITGGLVGGIIQILWMLLPALATLSDPQYSEALEAAGGGWEYIYLLLGTLINIPLLTWIGFVAAGVYGRLRLK
jgi:hypothetical protein